MAKVAPILQTFDAGELSPLLAARTDLAKYPNGCAVLENFLPTVQGPLVRRGGTQYIDTAKGRTLLVTFQVSERISYMLAFSHERIDVYADRGVLVDDGGVPVVIETPYDGADLFNADGTDALHVTQSADVMYLFHRNYPPHKLMRTAAATFTLIPVQFQNGPFDTINGNKSIRVSASASTGIVTLKASANLFDPAHVGTLFYMESSNIAEVKPWAVYQQVGVGSLRRVENRVYVCKATGGSGSVTGNQTPVHTEGRAWDGDGIDLPNDQRGPIGVEWEFLHAGYGIVEITAYTDAMNVTALVRMRLPNDVVFVSSGNSPTSSYITHLEPVGGYSSNTVRVYTASAIVSNGGVVRLQNTEILFEEPDGNTGSTLFNINGDYSVSGVQGASFLINVMDNPSFMNRLHGWYDLYILSGSVQVLNETVFKPTYKWAQSLFSSAQGWPEHGTFWRNRLALVEGRRVALSVSGDFENFSDRVDGQVQADSAIIQTLSARHINRVVWVAASDELVLGTDGDEWAIGPMQSTQAIGPENVIAERRTTYGSRGVAPVEIGGKILFVQGSGRVLRDYEFSFETDNYASSDTTKLNPEILASGVVDMAYQSEPDTIIWAVRADGLLVACTYDQEMGRSDIYAWHRHPMVNGFVEAVQTCPATDGAGDEVWLIVRREINGQTVRYLEVLNRSLAHDQAQAESFYVDCGLTYRGAPVSTISGLDHIEGQTVQVLTDGAVHPERVVQGGSITLDWEAGIIHVGLPAPCVMSSMGIEAGSQNGTSQGKLKRLTNVLCRLHRTLGGSVGSTRDNVQALNFRRADQAMNHAPALFTGDAHTNWPGGNERDARIWYINDQPLPVTLLALMPVVVTQDDR